MAWLYPRIGETALFLLLYAPVHLAYLGCVGVVLVALFNLFGGAVVRAYGRWGGSRSWYGRFVTGMAEIAARI